MCERLKQAVLKTAVPETVPGVRIPLPPPFKFRHSQRFVLRDREEFHSHGRNVSVLLLSVSACQAFSHMFSDCRITCVMGICTKPLTGQRGLYRGRDEIDRIAGALGLLILTFNISRSLCRRNWAMAVASGGYRASQVRRRPTVVPISSSPATAASPPFTSFSTSCPELNCAVLVTTNGFVSHSENDCCR